MSEETQQVNSRGLEWLINEQKKATELAAYLQGLIDDQRGTPRANYPDGSRRKSWTNEDRENLIRLVDLGHTAREISNMIGRPYNTVSDKVNRYKRTGSILRGGPEAYELCPTCGINQKLLTSKKCVNCYNENAKNAPKS
jgi:hypothetical protein